MTILRSKLQATPIHARVVPYVLIAAVAALRDGFSDDARYWLYLGEMLVGAWCIWEMWSLVPEMRWAASWEGVAVGILVFVLWVGLDPYYAKFSLLFKVGKPWNPFKQYGEGAELGWFFVCVRTLGSALVVPPIEEVFFRSFLYRYFVRLDFLEMPFSRLHWLSLIVTSLIFGFLHYEWLAGVLCGLSFQWLVLRKNRLGDAMTAHAITNFLLGMWVVWKGAWQFW